MTQLSILKTPVFHAPLLQANKTALYRLSAFHIFIIALSNYLVQIPVQIFTFEANWGTFSFPFIFLSTDLTIRIFGSHLARRIIFVVMMPALLISYGVSVLFENATWMGLSSLLDFNLFVFRIALASFSAYLFGQFMDIFVFNKLRQKKAWWVAPSTAAIFGNALDTILFYSIAFYRSEDPFMAANWTEIACVDYLFKILVCGLFFLPLYKFVLDFVWKRYLK